MLKIRPYEPIDRDQLVDIWEAASRVGHPFLTESDIEEQKALVRDIYLPQAQNWVAQSDHGSVGFIGLLDNFVGGLFVDPRVHRAGVGRELVEHAALLKGHLEVEVYARNEAAVLFYHRVSFVEIGRRSTDDQGRELELIRLRRD